MTIAEIKRTPRNTEALALLEAIINTVQDNEDASNLMVLVKIGDNYHRYSTNLTDTMSLIAALELAKFDVLQRMAE
jgi:hypothetical protein